ncbi:ferredoxin [Streptomyces malaysiensis]|uniref:ferredoxin n=1 Tax=Streptomyces malaysiensis TaxID=92644 RepID=UPI002B309A50|nr:ferredoxin [Streptomyces malaysiensis]
MQINVDRNRCEGHGLCEERGPRVFALDDDGELIHRFEGTDVPAEYETEAAAAVAACPVVALRQAGPTR